MLFENDGSRLSHSGNRLTFRLIFSVADTLIRAVIP